MASKRKGKAKKSARAVKRAKPRARAHLTAKKPAAKKPAPKPAVKRARLPASPHPRKRPRTRGENRPAASRLKLGQSPYDTGLDRNPANFQALTPLSHLARAATTYPDTIAVIHGKARMTYAQFYCRCRKLASALAARGIKKNDTVAAMLSNTPAMLEAHHGVPMAGAVLNALNTRLDAAAIAYMLEHGGAKILITDREFSATISAALALLENPPLVIDYDDPEFPQSGALLGEDYEAFVQSGDP